jgi:hypothetical protein
MNKSVPCLFLIIVISSCSNSLHNASYRIVLPEIPAAWREILGDPEWSIEWINRDGGMETSSSCHDIQVLQEWSSPVTAYPYWRNRGIEPKVMKPAGAIFPYDERDGKIMLSWIGGVETEVYRMLAEAGDGISIRQPHYFDWTRFKGLLESAEVPVYSNPYLADWKTICVKTVQSGFDKRRITASASVDFAIPYLIGQNLTGQIFIGTSPFAEPITDCLLHIKTDGTTDTYFSKDGTLKVNKNAWIWIPKNGI